jgi:hypothetical protein
LITYQPWWYALAATLKHSSPQPLPLATIMKASLVDIDRAFPLSTVTVNSLSH